MSKKGAPYLDRMKRPSNENIPRYRSSPEPARSLILDSNNLPPEILEHQRLTKAGKDLPGLDQILNRRVSTTLAKHPLFQIQRLVTCLSDLKLPILATQL